MPRRLGGVRHCEVAYAIARGHWARRALAHVPFQSGNVERKPLARAGAQRILLLLALDKRLFVHWDTESVVEQW